VGLHLEAVTMAKQHPTTPLEEALEAWGNARQGLAAEADNIPSAHFDFCPSPESRSVAELLRHVLEVSFMMVGELRRQDTNFHRAPWPELISLYNRPLKKAGTKKEIVALLGTSLTAGSRIFRRIGEKEMLRTIRRFDNLRGTKLAWLHHGIAHEEYHRGQLALYARLLGREPALTRLIRTGK
jgi:DinB superfamily